MLPSLLFPVVCDPNVSPDLKAEAVLSLSPRGTEGVPVHAIAARSRPGLKERLVVISQTCDIARSTNIEPNVLAARAYYTKSAQAIVKARHSTRWFLMETLADETALIVDMTRVVSIEKSLLCRLEPHSCSAPAGTYRAFARWLGDRFARPAYSDPFNSAILRPIQEAIRGLIDEQDSRVLFLNSQGVELRMVPPGESPPFPLTIYALLPSDPPEGNAFEARLVKTIADVAEDFFAGIDEKDLEGRPSLTPVRFDRMSAQQFLDLDPLRFT